MNKPKLTVHRFNEEKYVYEECEKLDGERITNAAGVVKSPGFRWTGLSASPGSLLTGMVVNGIDITPEGITIFISSRANHRDI